MNSINPKVLLVEDSKFMRIANERVLTKAGYDVICAADGEEAIRLATEKQPDVILLDMMLPKLGGPEVLRALKKTTVTAAIPVIVLTSLSQKNEQKLLAEGAEAYLEKSALELDTKSEGLAATVQNVLARTSKARAHSTAGVST
jgi:CheY-like chemotaxis protein